MGKRNSSEWSNIRSSYSIEDTLGGTLGSIAACPWSTGSWEIKPSQFSLYSPSRRRQKSSKARKAKAGFAKQKPEIAFHELTSRIGFYRVMTVIFLIGSLTCFAAIITLLFS